MIGQKRKIDVNDPNKRKEDDRITKPGNLIRLRMKGAPMPLEKKSKQVIRHESPRREADRLRSRQDYAGHSYPRSKDDGHPYARGEDVERSRSRSQDAKRGEAEKVGRAQHEVAKAVHAQPNAGKARHAQVGAGKGGHAEVRVEKASRAQAGTGGARHVQVGTGEARHVQPNDGKARRTQAGAKKTECTRARAVMPSRAIPEVKKTGRIQTRAEEADRAQARIGGARHVQAETGKARHVQPHNEGDGHAQIEAREVDDASIPDFANDLGDCGVPEHLLIDTTELTQFVQEELGSIASTEDSDRVHPRRAKRARAKDDAPTLQKDKGKCIAAPSPCSSSDESVTGETEASRKARRLQRMMETPCATLSIKEPCMPLANNTEKVGPVAARHPKPTPASAAPEGTVLVISRANHSSIREAARWLGDDFLTRLKTAPYKDVGLLRQEATEIYDGIKGLKADPTSLEKVVEEYAKDVATLLELQGKMKDSVDKDTLEKKKAETEGALLDARFNSDFHHAQVIACDESLQKLAQEKLTLEARLLAIQEEEKMNHKHREDAERRVTEDGQKISSLEKEVERLNQSRIKSTEKVKELEDLEALVKKHKDNIALSTWLD